MAAGQKHHRTGTIHVALGHAIVFERVCELEDDRGARHQVSCENRALSWEEAKACLSPDNLSALESIAGKVLAFDTEREVRRAEEARKAAEEDARKAAEKASAAADEAKRKAEETKA